MAEDIRYTVSLMMMQIMWNKKKTS